MICFKHDFLFFLILASLLYMNFVQRALKVYPDGPAAIRLGIGLCCYKLGHHEKARLAFRRVLQVNKLITSS